MPEVQMDQSPKNVLLFSGHMIDAPDRKTPRFPADEERTAAAAIAQTLDAVSNLRTQDRMKSLASEPRFLIPGHDPAVFERFARITEKPSPDKLL